MQAAVLTAYGRMEWKTVADPEIRQADEVLIRVACAGICGSDRHIFSGDFHPRTTVPLIQGHEFAGTIVAVGKGVKQFQPGDRVVVDPIIWCGSCPACEQQHYPACSSLKLIGVDLDGGFAEYVLAREFQLHALFPEISWQAAALVEMLAIGFHACRRAGVTAGQSLAIWGGGRIGQSILQAARTITTAPIYLIDVLDSRLAGAADCYPDIVCINPLQRNPVDVIKAATGGRGVDIAFEAVGHAVVAGDSPPPVVGCIRVIRGAGVVCVLGLADEPAPIVLKELIWKEARIVASRVTHGEFPQAITCLAQGLLHPQALSSAEFPASEAQAAFVLLEKEPAKYLKILLQLA